ncbi:MAG: hypothetical protein HY784_00780 [Chloroflexi bacterium]|nr:hypothetical protein [Chloroflexota bacterium]
MLAPDKANYPIAFGSTILAMLFSVLGWVCLFVGQRKLYKTTASSDVSEAGSGGHIA